MNENEAGQCCVPEPKNIYKEKYYRIRNGIVRWIFLNVWCRHLYCPTMRLMHRFNLHYAPPSPLSPQFGEIPHWCQWCGLRGSTFKVDLNAPLEPIREKLKEKKEVKLRLVAKEIEDRRYGLFLKAFQMGLKELGITDIYFAPVEVSENIYDFIKREDNKLVFTMVRETK